MELQKAFLPVLYWKKVLEMVWSLLKSFGMKDVNAVDDVYLHDGDMTKNQTVSSFNLGER